MKLVIIAGLALMLSSQAMALHYFDCSNANSSVQVVEHEVWGANPVGCIYKGTAVEEGTVTLHMKSKQSMEITGNKKRPPGGDWKETFAVKATLATTSPKGLPEPVSTQFRASVDAWLLCHEVSTSARDFAGAKTHCEVKHD